MIDNITHKYVELEDVEALAEARKFIEETPLSVKAVQVNQSNQTRYLRNCARLTNSGKPWDIYNIDIKVKSEF